MPIVEGKISGIELTQELTERIETEMTNTLRDTISFSFAVGLGYQEGTKEFEVAYKRTQEIMPGWTWISLVNQPWAIRGKRMSAEVIVARIHIFLLATAVPQKFRQQVAADVFKVMMNILSQKGKKVHMVVDVIEGEIDMTLPDDLFSTLLRGADNKLLTVPEVVEAMKKDLGKLLGK
jgi:hypothetical protein